MNESNVVNIMEQLKALREENDAMRAKLATRSVSRISLRVSAKGAVSVYGLGRFPVTIYSEQWLRLLGVGEDIKAFIAAHRDELSVKEKKDKGVKAQPEAQAQPTGTF